MKTRIFALALAGTGVALILACAPSPDTSTQNGSRLPDGKPDFTGLWSYTPPPPQRPVSQFQGGNSQKQPTRRELGLQNIPLTEWGREAFLYYTAGDSEWAGETGFAGDPRYHLGTCGGPKNPADLGNTFHLYQTPQMLMITSSVSEPYRQPWIRKIWIGGQHPSDLTDYVPFWMGHSVGNWEGDVLVVDTVRIKEGTPFASPLIPSGVTHPNIIPQSGNLRIIERFSVDASGNLQIARTFEDPVAFTKPWSDSWTLLRDTKWEAMKQSWEVEEPHAVCDPKGGYSREDDPWFDNFDTLKKEILPDAARLEKGLPPVPEQYRQQ